MDCDGDPGTGIWPVRWEVKGGFQFDSQQDFEAFKSALVDAFELVAYDLPSVTTFEEERQQIEKEERIFNPKNDGDPND